ncbi:MAG: TraR/DksA C4-type zinc finger protein [Minwuia sp.]|nr:TraR/DksA C4-type zinc finger protein [Minwuia sp.]
MAEHEDIRRQLVARRKELQARLSRFEEQLSAEPDPDVEDRAVEREDDEPMETLGLSGQKELVAIDAALKRFADGAFGACVTCDGQISQERLALLPHTPFCKDCAPRH